MRIETFIELYEKGAVTEEVLEQMQHFAFTANDDELFIIAQMYSALGHASQAVDLVEPLLEKYPSEMNLKAFLADLYLDLAEDEKALDLLANQSGDSDVKMLLLEADMYMAQGLFEVAEEKLKKALTLEPENELIQLAYAEFYYHIGEFEEALGRYLDLIDCGLQVEINVYERLAACYSHIGEFEKALAQFELSEKYFGALSTDQLFNQGFIAYRLENYDVALTALQKIQELDPSYDTIYPLMARIYHAQTKHEKGLEMVQEGLSHNEYSSELYFLKGMILEAMKDWAGARDGYYEALNLDPEDLESALRSNRMNLALEAYEDILHDISHYEDNGIFDERFTWDLALAYTGLEQYEEALAAFERAETHFNKEVEFLYDYAHFLLEEGRREEAQVRLESILQLDGSFMPARELLENLM